MAANSHMMQDVSTQDISVKELILRQKMMRDAILVYGLMISAIAGACGILIYFQL